MQPPEPWGVLIAGLGGYTGTTFALGVRAHQKGIANAATTTTHHGAWCAAGLPSLDHLVVGGWDTTGEPLLARARRQGVLPEAILRLLGDDPTANAAIEVGVSCRADFGADPFHPQVDDPVGYVRESIRQFKARNALSTVVLVILLPPELLPPPAVYRADSHTLQVQARSPDESGIRSSHLYLMAGLLEDCPAVDFTANVGLELAGIRALAQGRGIPVAGRDGSTGETMLKLHIADLLKQRRLNVQGWFGANILGNPDGLALSEPDRRVTKMADKSEGLEHSLGYPVSTHGVAIDYYRPRGDNKESWDVVDFACWLGGKASLRLNWQGPDSLLAGQILCDIVRIMGSHLVRGTGGVVSELGYFFKHPLGTSERSLSAMWQKLHELLGRS